MSHHLVGTVCASISFPRHGHFCRIPIPPFPEFTYKLHYETKSFLPILGMLGFFFFFGFVFFWFVFFCNDQYSILVLLSNEVSRDLSGTFFGTSYSIPCWMWWKDQIKLCIRKTSKMLPMLPNYILNSGKKEVIVLVRLSFLLPISQPVVSYYLLSSVFIQELFQVYE